MQPIIHTYVHRSHFSACKHYYKFWFRF